MKKEDEWEYYRKPSGQKSYNKKCNHCLNACKQSFRTVIIFCPVFRKRRELPL